MVETGQEVLVSTAGELLLSRTIRWNFPSACVEVSNHRIDMITCDVICCGILPHFTNGVLCCGDT